MTLHQIVLLYLAIAFVLCLGCIGIGELFKKDILHGGMRLGVVNSFLLSIVWPITVICIFCGWVYDGIQAWKKL